MSKTRKEDVTRGAILKSARTVFGKWGMEKSTMEDIARAAGKGKSTLYYYYKTKEEIFDECVKADIGKLLTTAKTSLEGVSSARERLRRYIVTLVGGLRSAVPLNEIVRGENARDPNFLLRTLDQFKNEETRFLHEILAFGVRQNQLGFANDQEQETASKVIFEVMEGILLLLVLNEYDERHTEMAARIIVNGI